MNKCYEHIRPVRDGYHPANGVVHGLVHARIEELEDLFGLRHDDGDGLTYSCAYFISTPRGLAVVRDSWDNPESVQSLISEDKRAVEWLRAYFRKHGVETLTVGLRGVHYAG